MEQTQATSQDQVRAAVRRAALLCGGLAALGVAVGVPTLSAKSVVWAWTNRGGVPIEHCVAIERATAGAVTRRDLRPADWHRIWPELVTLEHPAPVDEAQRAPAEAA